MAGKIRTLDIAYMSMFSAIMAICSWISIPFIVPFTLQTFGIFLTMGLLGGKRGTAAIVIYLLLGFIGAPVFSGFKGGMGALLGSTGGYIIGFIFTALVMWAMEHIDKKWALPLSMVLGLAVCYFFGTAWFIVVYSHNTAPIGIWAAVSTCVLPYLVPDAVKIILATLLSYRLRKYIK